MISGKNINLRFVEEKDAEFIIDMRTNTKKNKYLCLFYDNPKAGAIYKRLGFIDTEKWVMLDKR